MTEVKVGLESEINQMESVLSIKSELFSGYGHRKPLAGLKCFAN
jgi:hypothetical protein